MKCIVRNLEQLRNHFADASKMIQDGQFVNLIYEPASKPKTKAQMGFVFAAILAQTVDYLRDCGYTVDNKDVRYFFYRKVSELVPELVVDNPMLIGEPRVRHIDEYDRTLMSKFIDGCFRVIDTNPMFEDLVLTPDTYYNWVFHIEPEELRLFTSASLPERDQSYLAHVRTRPCLICGVQHKSEAHHLKHPQLCGLTQKAPDWAAIPLCHDCHMGIAHGTGFKERIKWITDEMDIITFLRISYQRYVNNLDF